MSTWKLTVSALVLGLVFCGAANAAVTNLTFTLEVVDYVTGVALTPAEIAGLAGGNTFGVAVYGLATGVPDDNGVYAASWTVYTPNSNGVVEPVAAAMSPVTAIWGPTLDFGNKAGASKKDFANSVAFPTGSTLDPDTDKDAVGASVSTPGDLTQWTTLTLVQTQLWTVLSGKSGADMGLLAVAIDPRAQYVNFDSPETGYVTTFETVGSQGNTPPTIVTVSKSQITESDWDTNGGGGYNNLLHSIDVSAVGDDEDDDPLTFRWMMSKPGGGSLTLAETGAALHMTLADIASLGLPDWTGPGNPANIWDLTVEAFDGTAYSAPTHISTFVPEPATMGLLAFGVVGLLKRRRRA